MGKLSTSTADVMDFICDKRKKYIILNKLSVNQEE